MIRSLLFAVGVASLAALYNVPPTHPAIDSVAVREVSLGDSSQYWIRYGLSKVPRVGDSIKVVFHRDTVNALAVINSTKWRFFRFDSAAFTVAKVYGKLAKFSGCVSVKNGAYASTPVCRTWSTLKVDSIPPVVDSVGIDSSLSIIGIDVKPDTVHLINYYDSTGSLHVATQQFCSLVEFKDGKVALRTSEASFPVCTSEYAKLAMVKKGVTPAQQSIADRFCPHWTAPDGGSVTNEVCGSPS